VCMRHRQRSSQNTGRDCSLGRHPGHPARYTHRQL
jgi:hypothetical protein